MVIIVIVIMLVIWLVIPVFIVIVVIPVITALIGILLIIIMLARLAIVGTLKLGIEVQDARARVLEPGSCQLVCLPARLPPGREGSKGGAPAGCPLKIE